jgi:hypothetical protein
MVEWNRTSAYDQTKNSITGWSPSVLNPSFDTWQTMRDSDLDSAIFYDCWSHDRELREEPNQYCITSLWFNVKANNERDARMGILKTWVIIFLFGASIYFFTNDSDTFVIGPIERMVHDDRSRIDGMHHMYLSLDVYIVLSSCSVSIDIYGHVVLAASDDERRYVDQMIVSMYLSTWMHIYIDIYICACVCVCVCRGGGYALFVLSQMRPRWFGAFTNGHHP